MRCALVSQEFLADARACVSALEHEEPAFDVGPRRRGRKPGAEREVVRRSVLGLPAELDPGVTDAPIIAAEQQIPGHPLARIAVGLDARGLELSIEQEGQGEREHLGLAGAVVAAQQEMAVAKPELLAVVMEELDQPQPQRLPARKCRCRQHGSGRRRGQNLDRLVHLGSNRVSAGAGRRISASPSAKRASAGSGRMVSPSRAINCNCSRRLSAMAASSRSEPGSRADLRQ